VAEIPCGSGGHSSVTLIARSESTSAPLAILSPPSGVAAAAHDQLLKELWASVPDSSVSGGRGARFRLHADPGGDACDGDFFSPAQHERLLSFVRERVFDAWRSVTPELRSLAGSFELFNPALGANMGWHQDGHAAGELVAHYYLAADDEDMAWAEVALPPAPPSEGEAEAPGFDFSCAVDFGSSDELSRGVAASNFVAVGCGADTAAQPICVFEDSAVLHRTPLTAAGKPQLQSRRRRPMARLVFYGTDADGATLRFPPPHSAPQALRAAAPRLPEGLVRVLCEFGMKKRGWTGKSRGPAAETRLRYEALMEPYAGRYFSEALCSYVAGGEEAVAFVGARAAALAAELEAEAEAEAEAEKLKAARVAAGWVSSSEEGEEEGEEEERGVGASDSLAQLAGYVDRLGEVCPWTARQRAADLLFHTRKELLEVEGEGPRPEMA